MTFSSRSTAALAAIACLMGDADGVGDASAEMVRTMYASKVQQHKNKLQTLAKKMDFHKALEVVRSQGNATANAELMSIVQVNGAHRGRNLRHKSTAVATDEDESTPATKESSVLKAIKLINEMIYKVHEKYDAELEKCCEFDKTQSELMEDARQGIAADNARAAEARKNMLSATAFIQVAEKEIPELKDTLEELIKTCTAEIKVLDENIATVSGDVDEMTEILKMVECADDDTSTTVTTTAAAGGASALQMYTCEDSCGGTYNTFMNATQLSQRQQALAVRLFTEASADDESADEDSEGNRASEENQETADGEDGTTTAAATGGTTTSTGTTTTMPDVTTVAPRTVKRSRPCKTPVVMDPKSAKCTISNSPSCPKIREKFEAIQTEFIETQTDLEQKRADLDAECKKQQANLEAQISAYEIKLKEANTALAAATAENSEALEASRLKSVQLAEFMEGYRQMTDECHTNYDAMEAEECALTKIRGEVVTKIDSAGDLPLFQDCVVSNWTAATDCTVPCGGGTLEMARTIETYPFRGSACPKLKEVVSCNVHKCPIDCKLADWAGWSSCTAECGGGVSERMRDIVQEPLHGGDACGETQEVVGCNQQACDKDCVLADWTVWSSCSKPCDLGHRQRFQNILEPKVGQGKCPTTAERQQSKVCNAQACPVLPLKCKVKTDLVLVIDGSGSIRSAGWAASIAGAKKIVTSMDLENSGSQVALIVYSGPKSYCQYYQCVGYSRTWWFRWYCGRPRPNPYCGVDRLSGFSSSTSTLTGLLTAAKWPARGTYTKHALRAANVDLTRGRSDATSTVVVMTDGWPADRRGTYYASREVKKKAHLVYVPVTKYAPLKYIKMWASSPDSVVSVSKFSDLTKTEIINKITASSCADVTTR